MPIDVSTCNLTVKSNDNTTGLVHYYIFLTICMCKYYDKYIKPFSKRARRSAPSILVSQNKPVGLFPLHSREAGYNILKAFSL